MASSLVLASAGQTAGWEQFLAILSKPDNMPVAGALLLVIFFTWVALRQARRHDRLIREGRKRDILSEMQK
ncbi:MAG: hypothetical protein D6815_01995 [Candidatus Dadabacteria bacterium]|nr:MAG: hypothetical protein D6815_01995 [Candidatus Dadabacteria bacterium]